MDSNLLKERADFLKRVRAQPAVEKKAKDEPSTKKFKPGHKSKPNWSTPSTSASAPFDYKTAAPTSQHKLAVLYKVVDYLKKRHHRGDNYPISIDDLLDEANMLDILPKHKNWLDSEALKKNSKVEVVDGSLYKFKPKLPITTRKELLKYLKVRERKGLGGVWEEDVDEALPNATKDIESLVKLDKIYLVARADKKRVLYFKDGDVNYRVDEEFVKLWRSAAVDNADERTVEEYLQKQGISTMENLGLRTSAPKRKTSNKKRVRQFKKLNDHLDGVLKDYAEKN